jgi:hypothetical protein
MDFRNNAEVGRYGLGDLGARISIASASHVDRTPGRRGAAMRDDLYEVSNHASRCDDAHQFVLSFIKASGETPWILHAARYLHGLGVH